MTDRSDTQRLRHICLRLDKIVEVLKDTASELEHIADGQGEPTAPFTDYVEGPAAPMAMDSASAALKGKMP